jgi:hypothetical protein
MIGAGVELYTFRNSLILETNLDLLLEFPSAEFDHLPLNSFGPKSIILDDQSTLVNPNSSTVEPQIMNPNRSISANIPDVIFVQVFFKNKIFHSQLRNLRMNRNAMAEFWHLSLTPFKKIIRTLFEHYVPLKKPTWKKNHSNCKKISIS